MKYPIVAWLIMLFQGMNPFDKNATSHRAMRYTFNNRTFVIDATKKYGVRDISEGDFLQEYTIVEHIYIPYQVEDNRFFAWLDELKEKKYDSLQLLGLFLKLVGLLTFNTIGHNFKKLTCNEVFLNWAETFLKLAVGDSDNWDLLMTDVLASEVGDGIYGEGL